MIRQIYLIDRADVLIGSLNLQDFIQFERYQEINGAHYMNIQISKDHTYSDHFIKYNKIIFYDTDKAKWYEFIIQKPDKDLTTIIIYAESSIYSLHSNFIDFASLTGNAVLTGLNELLTTAYPATNKWAYGTTTITGSYYMQRSKCSLYEAVFDWAVKVGGEIDENITITNNILTRAINIVTLGENRGKTIYDDREISSFTETSSIDDIFTAAYGYGSFTDEVQLTFADEVWEVANGDPVDKPAGQEYVSLGAEVINAYGEYVSGTYYDRTTSYEDTEETYAAELLTKTYNWLINNILDKTQYDLTIADLKALNFTQEEIRLGDFINIVVTALDLKLQPRIIGYLENYLNPALNDVKFNFQQDTFENTINQANKTANEAKSGVNQLSNKSVLTGWNNEINASGANVFSNATDGIIVLDAATQTEAVKAIQLKGGAFRIANSKTDGEWDWTTIGTGDGIIADAIYSGKLSGANFELDMDAGTLSFGNRVAGTLVPVIQFSATGQTILGAEINLEQTATSMRYYNKYSNETIAEFTTEGITTPTLTVETLFKNGKYRAFQTDDVIVGDNTHIRYIELIED